MPAHNLELGDPESLARLLLTIVMEHKNELRIRACDYDAIDAGRLLVVDFDRDTGEIVIRATSGWGRARKVSPENAAWTMPAQESPLNRARVEATAKARQVAVRTDEELAEMEEALQKRQSLAKAEEESGIPLRIHTRK
jgi:hypothetical protein